MEGIYIHHKGCDEIIYPFPKFNDNISNLIPYFTGYVITYPYWD